MSDTLRSRIEKLRDELNPNAELGDERDIAGIYGFNECLSLLWPIVEEQIKFCKKFSPGDDWFPEMRDALAALEERISEKR